MATGPFDLGGLTLKELATRVWSEISDDNVWDAAAQLGYYFMLALFPLVIFMLSLVALLPTHDVVGPFMATLQSVMPASAYELMGREIQRILESSSGGLLTFGMLGTIWAASSGVVSLIGTLNRAYEAKETRGFVKLRALAMGLTFALVILLIAGSVLLTMGDNIAGWAAGLLGLTWVTKLVGTGINYALGLGMLFIALELVYYFGPDIKDQKWRWVSPGSIAGVLLFVLSSVGFSLYVRFNDSYSVTYGSIGAVIVLMLWLYLLGLSIVLGAEINSEIAIAAAERGDADAPDENVQSAASERETREGGKGDKGRTEKKAGEGRPEPKGGRKPEPAPAAAPKRETRAPLADAASLAPIFDLTSDSAPADRLVLRDVLRSLVHDNARVRAGAAATLGHMRPDDPAAAALLVTRLTDDDLGVRGEAIRAIERIGAPAVPALERAAAEGGPEQRRVATQVLERLRRAA
jgi:membrane protein